MASSLIHALNDDLLALCFRSLKAKELVRCPEVCAQWRLVANRPELWTALCGKAASAFAGSDVKRLGVRLDRGFQAGPPKVLAHDCTMILHLGEQQVVLPMDKFHSDGDDYTCVWTFDEVDGLTEDKVHKVDWEYCNIDLTLWRASAGETAQPVDEVTACDIVDNVVDINLSMHLHASGEQICQFVEHFFFLQLMINFKKREVTMKSNTEIQEQVSLQEFLQLLWWEKL